MSHPAVLTGRIMRLIAERLKSDENLNKIENCNVDELCFQHLAGSETDNLTPAYRLFRVPIRTIFHSTPISMRYFSVYRKIRNHYDIIHLHL